jgi:hypothetical protein
MLGEAHIDSILRPPPVGTVPQNVAHPFQKSFYTYFTKKFIPKHWFLLGGFTVAITLYGTLDELRDAGKKKAYDTAVLEGRQPCRCRDQGWRVKTSDRPLRMLSPPYLQQNPS